MLIVHSASLRTVDVEPCPRTNQPRSDRQYRTVPTTVTTMVVLRTLYRPCPMGNHAAGQHPPSFNTQDTRVQVPMPPLCLSSGQTSLSGRCSPRSISSSPPSSGSSHPSIHSSRIPLHPVHNPRQWAIQLARELRGFWSSVCLPSKSKATQTFLVS